MSASMEYRERLASGSLTDAELDTIGTDEEGMMIGFACNDTQKPERMPINLAHQFTR